MQSLVEVKTQVDYFRFGNGGVLQSSQRVRLPVPLLDRIVLIWICEIPCESLGCLLGKDFLESMGAVLDFVGNRMQLKFLGDRWIPLSKMKAGHYGLNLLPADLSRWPKLSDEAWHDVGVGGVCEVQCTGKMMWKVQTKMSAASGDLNMVVHFIPEPYLSKEAFTVENVGAPTACSAPCGAMEPPGGANADAQALALSGPAAVAHPKAFPEIPSHTFAYGVNLRGVEEAGSGHGETPNLAEALVVSGPTSVHCGAPQRCHDLAVADGTAGEFHGGRGGDFRAEGREEKEPCSPTSSPGGRDSQSSGRAGWPTRRPGTRVGRTQRRSSSHQSRADQAGGAAGSGRSAEGHRGGHHDQGETDGGSAEEQDSSEAISDEWQQPAGSWVSERISRSGATGKSASPSPTSPKSSWASSGSRECGEPAESRVGHAAQDGQPARDVPDGSRYMTSDEVRKSIGSLTTAAFNKLKRGIREVLVAAAVKAKRLKAKLGAPKDYVVDKMIDNHMQNLEKIALGEHREGFAAEVEMPSLPDFNVYESVYLPTPRMGEKRNRRKKPMEIDEWRYGHVLGWMCRDHYTPRRTFFAPWNGATAPRFLPGAAFTGRRRTVIFDAEGNREETVDDNFREDRNPTRQHAWVGETWVEVYWPWLFTAYPHPDDGNRDGVLFTEEMRVLGDGGDRGMHTMANGDQVFVARNTMNCHGTLPIDNTVPISTFVKFRGQDWIVLEHRVLHRDRAHHRLKYGVLAQEAVALLQIHHLSMMDRDGETPRKPFVGELYTETEPVSRAALRRGHSICPSVTLKTGYDLRVHRHRKRATAHLRKQRPYCLVIAFPCSIWSVLQNLGPSGDTMKRRRLDRRRKLEAVLVEYAAERALDQLLHGCHFILENPASSAAWRLVGKLRELVERRAEIGLYYVRIDQCHFGLRGAGGGLHQKPTNILTSSYEVAYALEDCRCSKDHQHEPVIGGHKVTELAGHYPPAMAERILDGLEAEFEKLYHEVNVVSPDAEDDAEDDGDESGFDDDEDDAPAGDGPDVGEIGDGLHADPEGRAPDAEALEDIDIPDGAEGEQPSAAEKKLAAHLHE